ncbi:MAG: hypothetical protein JJE04_02145 [Acidobacteriia bacterium]|nr:hypothetical protein [Terriglobia bacterium]
MRKPWILIAVLVVAIILVTVVAKRRGSPALHINPDAAAEIEKAKRR